LFDCSIKNNGRQYEGSTTPESPHPCVGKERKFIAVTKPRNDTKKLNLTETCVANSCDN